MFTKRNVNCTCPKMTLLYIARCCEYLYDTSNISFSYTSSDPGFHTLGKIIDFQNNRVNIAKCEPPNLLKIQEGKCH